VKPDWTAGLRTASAMVLPLAIGWATGRPELVWVGLGGWLGSLADPGGPYRERAISIATFAVAAAAFTALGGLLATPVWVAAPALFVCALLCSLVRVRGDTAATMGVLALVMFCITQGQPAPVAMDLERGALLGVGALFALALSVAFWPFRPYRPVRRAVASVWSNLGNLIAAVAETAASGAAPAAWDSLAVQRRRTRELLERARNAVAAARVGRSGETGRGLQLLLLYELSDLSLGEVAAVSEELRAAIEEHHAASPAALAALGDLSKGCDAIAASIAEESEAKALEPLPAARAGERAVIDRLRAAVVQARQAALALEHGGEAPAIAGEPPAPMHRPSVRDVLAPKSTEFQHSLRVAIVTTVASVLAAALHFQRSYWVTLSAILVLQPHGVATVRRALQRVGGTVVGGIFAALIARLVHDRLVLVPILFFTAWAAVAVRRINYAAFATLVTPAFVLLAEAGAGGPHLTRTRIVDTLLGGALALLGALTLWPTRELERMPALIAAVLHADGDYLAAVSGHEPDLALVAARRRVGLAASNAEAALQRLLGETHPSARVEAVMALLAYARRISASITSLRDAPLPPDAAIRLRETLAKLATAAEGPTVPPPLPSIDGATLPEPAQRLLRQLHVIHSAAARFAVGE
jgi:uncharacterized membrane protein YccC